MRVGWGEWGVGGGGVCVGMDGDGCNLLPRCPFAENRCSEEQEFLEIVEGHGVSCWKAIGGRPTDID